MISTRKRRFEPEDLGLQEYLVQVYTVGCRYDGPGFLEYDVASSHVVYELFRVAKCGIVSEL